MRLLPLFLAACTTGAVIIPEGEIDTSGSDSGSESETQTDPGPVDADKDGFTEEEDCDDNNPEIHPDAEERCDSEDWNCSGNAFDDACPCETSPTDFGIFSVCIDSEPFGRANGICDQAGMELAWPRNPDENAAFTEIARDIRRQMWIGITDREDEGDWRTVTGESITYDNWQRGQPDNWRGAEHCAQLQPWTGEWNDIGCDQRQAWICRSE